MPGRFNRILQMKHVLHVVSLFLFSSSIFAEEKRNEDSYAQEWCAKNQGESEARLPDGARVDCLLPDYAVEFDWGKGLKVYECIGQALFYAAETKRKPACMLIQKSGQSNESFYRHARRALVAAKASGVIVWCINPEGIKREC
ncbi:MAG: hypothetical protein ACR2P5_03175 [Gammaproteobacteria bacterium]